MTETLSRAHPRRFEWLGLAGLACAVVWFAAGHALLQRLDRTLHDAAMVLWKRTPPADIAIVAIDEESLAALGQWPWPRTLTATLVERLAQAQARTIVVDIVFSEPDRRDPNGDRVMAEVIARAGNVVLAAPVVNVPGEGLRDLWPIEAMRGAARALGHIAVDLDDDGVLRRVPLLDGAREQRPYLALAALNAAGLPAPGKSLANADGRYAVPFYGPERTIAHQSAVSVLRGDLPPGTFGNKIVFVGVTAAALGDTSPSPAGGRVAPLAGVEFAAQAAAALHEGSAIRYVSPAIVAFVSSLVVLLLFATYRVVHPRVALVATVGLFFATLAGAFLALRVPGVWIPPAAALAGIGSAYPLWAWRRLEGALRYMRAELARLQSEPTRVPVAMAHGTLGRSLDAVDGTIEPLRDAVATLRDTRRFIADAIESLPQAVMVADLSGAVVMSNTRAREWSGLDLGAGGGEAPRLTEALAPFRLPGARTWESVLDEPVAGRPAETEATGPGGRVVMAQVSLCHRADGTPSGRIVNLVDVSEKREAQRRREDVLRLLSHDMRSPLASILTLIETRDADPKSVDTEGLLSRVRSFARRTLGLADDFLRLARAEHLTGERFAEVDLADVVSEACEEAWTLAQAKAIAIDCDVQVAAAPVLGDRALLLRMLLNLLGNAVKYSRERTRITVTLEPQGVSWLVRVSDQGSGIAREDLPSLFTRFGRLVQPGRDPGGVGLGLVMVRAVVERHRGVVSVASEVGVGTVFSVSLPALRQAAGR